MCWLTWLKINLILKENLLPQKTLQYFTNLFPTNLLNTLLVFEHLNVNVVFLSLQWDTLLLCLTAPHMAFTNQFRNHMGQFKFGRFFMSVTGGWPITNLSMLSCIYVEWWKPAFISVSSEGGAKRKVRWVTSQLTHQTIRLTTSSGCMCFHTNNASLEELMKPLAISNILNTGGYRCSVPQQMRLIVLYYSYYAIFPLFLLGFLPGADSCKHCSNYVVLQWNGLLASGSTN